MNVLDLRDLECPAPVVETRKLLLADPAAAQSVLVGSTTARETVSRMAQTLGYTVSVVETAEGFQLTLTPGDTPQPADNAEAAPLGKTVVYVGNNSMGGDNRELGEKLMVAFVCTLLELEKAPEMALFINEGVKLTTAGSPAIEALEKLTDRGTEIVSCGLCLDFFDRKETLMVGRVGSMLETVEAFASAGRIIRP